MDNEYGEEMCPICGGSDFENQSGHYYCTECGTQSQMRRDEAEDEEVIGIMSHQIRVKKGDKSKLTSEEKEYAHTLHQCWQIIYKGFLDQLVKEGFNPLLKVTGKLLWFLYLDHIYQAQLEAYNKVDTMEMACNVLTGGVSFEAVRKLYYIKTKDLSSNELMMLRDKSLSLCRKRKRNVEDSEEEEEDNDTLLKGGMEILEDINKMKKVITRNQFIQTQHAFVTKRTILGLAYMALLYSEQYIIQSDFVYLTYSDAIMYHSWYKLLPHGLAKRFFYYQSLRVHERRMPVRVCDFGFMVRHIKRGIGLYTLPLDIAIIGTVMLQKMLLPVESLLPLLKRLYYILHEDPLTKQYFVGKRRPNVNVDLTVMVNVLILIKLLYRLDDTFEKQQSSYCISTDKPFDKSKYIYLWEDWVTLATREHYRTLQSTITPSKSDIVHLDDYRCYLKYCRDKCFSTYTLEAVTGTKKVYEKNHVIPPIYTSYMSKRKARNTNKEGVIKQGDRPLFTIISDQVKNVHSDITPRWVPIDLEIPTLGLASSSYCPVPNVSYSVIPIDKLRLPTSQLFLYNFAAQLISVSTAELLFNLNCIEKVLLKYMQKEMDIVNVYTVSRRLGEEERGESDGEDTFRIDNDKRPKNDKKR